MGIDFLTHECNPPVLPLVEHDGDVTGALEDLIGAAILTVGVVIMKILGFFYKIPLGNILGDEGFSMFTGAYNIYFVFFTLATAGFPVAMSRMVAEADAKGRMRQEQKIFRVALISLSGIGNVRPSFR